MLGSGRRDHRRDPVRRQRFQHGGHEFPAGERGLSVREQVDAQYDVSRQVTDEDALLRSWSERAADARATLPHTLGLAYGPSQAETLDIFPAERTNAAVFVFVHGGYWRGGSAAMHGWIARGLRPLGITTVLLDYALCPQARIDQITRQVRAAIAWVTHHVAQHGGDPTRIAVGGHSAGAHLAAMALQTDWQRDYGLTREPLRCGLLVSGIYDLAPLRSSFLQADLHLDDQVIETCSPVRSVRPCSADLRITWGALEPAEFARQSTVYHQAWRAHGNQSVLGAVPGANHFSALERLADSDSDLCRWVADALR